jgi:hypothetical protein
MVGKLGELTKFLVFNSGIFFLGNRSVFAFYLLLFDVIPNSVFSCRVIAMGLVTLLNDYPHFDLAEDGRLCSTCQHCPGFPRVLYDALIRLGYDGDALIYRCRLSVAHGLDRCKVSVTVPFDPTEPWSGSVIGSEPDTGVEMMTHITLTSLCEDRLAATTALPIALLTIGNQKNPISQ